MNKESTIGYERLKQILNDYISNDAECSEHAYVLDTLRNVCGCEDEEIREIGFGYLLDTEE